MKGGGGLFLPLFFNGWVIEMCSNIDNQKQFLDTLPLYQLPCHQPTPHIRSPKQAKPIRLAVPGTDEQLPRPYKIMSNICKIDTCAHFNGALDSKDVLWLWGGSGGGVTEDGEYSLDVLPELDRVPQKAMDRVECFAMGASHILCVTKDHRLWSWGRNSFGQLGTGDFKPRESPTIVMEDVIAVYAGISNSYALTSDHSLWGWGCNFDRILLNEHDASLRDERFNLHPVHIMDDVVSFSSTGYSSYVIRSDGSLWGWGLDNSDGWFQLERGKPKKIWENTKKSAKDSDLANGFGFILSDDGDLYSYGVSVPGSLVPYRIRNRIGRYPIKVLSDVCDVTCGRYFSLIKMKDNSLYSSGANEYGQCGLGRTTEAFYKPKFVMNDVAQVSAGILHGMALQTNGDLWIWGRGYEHS